MRSALPFYSCGPTNGDLQRPLQARYKDILEDRSYLNKVCQTLRSLIRPQPIPLYFFDALPLCVMFWQYVV